MCAEVQNRNRVPSPICFLASRVQIVLTMGREFLLKSNIWSNLCVVLEGFMVGEKKTSIGAHNWTHGLQIFGRVNLKKMFFNKQNCLSSQSLGVHCGPQQVSFQHGWSIRCVNYFHIVPIPKISRQKS